MLQLEGRPTRGHQYKIFKKSHVSRKRANFLKLEGDAL